MDERTHGRTEPYYRADALLHTYLVLKNDFMLHGHIPEPQQIDIATLGADKHAFARTLHTQGGHGFQPALQLVALHQLQLRVLDLEKVELVLGCHA